MRPFVVLAPTAPQRLGDRGVKHFRACRPATHHCQSVSEAESEARHQLMQSNPSRDARKPTESTMKKFVFAALAMLGLVLGTASLSTPANATTAYPQADANH